MRNGLTLMGCSLLEPVVVANGGWWLCSSFVVLTVAQGGALSEWPLLKTQRPHQWFTLVRRENILGLISRELADQIEP
ncbi:hypothetical protein HNQ59_001808 [Chitinivorax tropicus]|uniref:Uncharacterized protein n=1 Tax=Chitinivorax tropicus TaxID=714531 RepID=A0A840MN37_9PROT|nr:hypothetical protein [Chitinivorax tropicus]MBB5018519.1 hypothetical protein [Chitinivorax tropicus]